MKGEDAGRIKQATEQLSQTATRLAEARAAAGAGADAGASAGGSTQEQPGVVDAEFEEVDKRDRKAS
jgi:molecular chaperone DnaK